jgi:hypothetical protein
METIPCLIKYHASLTSALDGGEMLASRPDRFNSRAWAPVPLDRRLGGPQGQSGGGGEEESVPKALLLLQ